MKQGKKSFADGTAQLHQYYGKAQTVPDFRGAVIRPLLITSVSTEAADYALWERLMQSERDYRLIAQE